MEVLPTSKKVPVLCFFYLRLQNLKSSSSTYDVCGVMLGTGSLLAWLGVLRYIGFFEQFNVSKCIQIFFTYIGYRKNSKYWDIYV